MKIVECHQLCKRYGAKHALDTVDLSLSAGEPIALVGPNGAGKTTLMALLCGFIRASSGDAIVLGHAPGSGALHGRVSALPQDAEFDPRFSIERQLCHYVQLQGMHKSDALRDVDRVLSLVELLDSKKSKPGTLSHGMRKRLSIAQALLGKPELVLLDEPTAGLDPVNAKTVRDLVDVCKVDTTFIVSSHNIDELEKLCSTVVYLEQGRLKEYVDITSQSAIGYLTITIASDDSVAAVAAIERMTGINEIKHAAHGNVVIHYDHQQYPTMDQQLLKLLADNHWCYKQLLKGRTLEEQLF